MTREEKLEKYLNHQYMYENGDPSYIHGIKVGVSWADENPKSQWISVEERLPETTDEFGRSEDVLILDENGWRTVAMYCMPENKWYLSIGAIQGECEYPFEITHWMPIPELPKEG